MKQLKVTLTFLFLIYFTTDCFAYITTICHNNGTKNQPVWSCKTFENVPCTRALAGSNGWTEYWDKCTEQYFSKPPIISVDRNGSAYIENDGVISQIGSDKLRQFYISHLSDISTEKTRTLLNELLRTDDGKVSLERLKLISQELKASIVTKEDSSSSSFQALFPLKRTLNPEEKITILESEHFLLNIKNTDLDNIGIVFKAMIDSKGNIYAVPFPLFGGVIPWSILPESYKATCPPPCANPGIAGECGKFCYRFLVPDKPPTPMGPVEGFFEDDNSVESVLVINSNKIQLVSKTKISKGSILLGIESDIPKPKNFKSTEWCSNYYKGFGTMIFPKSFEGSCDGAYEVISSLLFKANRSLDIKTYKKEKKTENIRIKN